MTHHVRRAEEAIRDALSGIFAQGLKDPRFPMILTVTGVRATRDLSEVKVNFSQIPDDPEAVDATLDALDNAKGYIRSELARRVSLRTMPDLRFYWDDGEAKSRRIHELLESAGLPPESGPEDAGG
ncbi:30S ribosome-binding factor RbfA [Candidatus Poribacteria bacterium]|nr:30S ribosome-binding factor RbfA [Candidatus Poribacteria bacterium]